MLFLPQINSNYILTQVPYKATGSFETVTVDMETGTRFAFARRNGGLGGTYPTRPLCDFAIDYPNITDAEVEAIRAFFNSVRGSWGLFSVLDPSGNLVPFSEDFTQWTTSGSVTFGAPVQDPFGGTLASSLIAGGTGVSISAVLGPTDGGINGTMVCVSVWARAAAPGQSIFIGMVDAGTSTLNGQTYRISSTSWTRISYRALLWDDSAFSMVIGGSSWNSGDEIFLFGAQATPAKGEAGYTKTPANFGYHKYCRFNVDVLAVRSEGPNQNSLSVPCIELGPSDSSAADGSVSLGPAPVVSGTISVWSSYTDTPGLTDSSMGIAAQPFNDSSPFGLSNTNEIVNENTAYALRKDTYVLNPGQITQINSSHDFTVSFFILAGQDDVGHHEGVFIRIYDCYIDVAYEDSTTARSRPSGYLVTNGNNVVGYGFLVGDPTLAFDEDADPPLTSVEFHRDEFDFLNFVNALELSGFRFFF